MLRKAEIGRGADCLGARGCLGLAAVHPPDRSNTALEEETMSTRDAKQSKRTYEQPRLTVHGTVERITQTGHIGHNERNPIFPGSQLRGPYDHKINH